VRLRRRWWWKPNTIVREKKPLRCAQNGKQRRSGWCCPIYKLRMCARTPDRTPLTYLPVPKAKREAMAQAQLKAQLKAKSQKKRLTTLEERALARSRRAAELQQLLEAAE
jgi:hypothetical protein